MCLSRYASAIGPSAVVADLEMGNGVARKTTGETREGKENKREAKAVQSERTLPGVDAKGLKKLFVLNAPHLFLGRNCTVFEDNELVPRTLFLKD
jgi:hypothetical protein